MCRAKNPVFTAIVLFGMLLVGSTVLGFKPAYHLQITQDALDAIFVGPISLNEIVLNNRATDFSGDLLVAENHFDNERLAASSQLLAFNLNSAAAQLDSCDKQRSMYHLGRALHALQDFYAHSNWVENQILDATVVPFNIPFFDRLVDVSADGTAFEQGPLTLNPNYLTTNPECLLVCDADPGPALGSDKVSTGYFTPPFSPPAGKCSHGGLNKDEPGTSRGAFVINAWELFEFARQAAERHTECIVGQFENMMIAKFGQERGEELFSLLTKDNRNIAFAIDDTGSMGDVIDSVKTSALNMLDTLENSQEFPTLHLFTFKDAVTYVGRRCTPSEFRSLIKAITASGGGDCPEASLSAVVQAISRVGSGGSVFLATDADPREGGELVDQAVGLGQAKGVSVNFLLTGSCAESGGGGASDNGDPGGSGLSERGSLSGAAAFAEIAAKTGGLLFQSTQDFEELTGVFLANTAPDFFTFLVQEGDVTSPTVDVISVDIDSSVTQSHFLLNATDGGSVALELWRPNGVEVQPTDGDAVFITTGSAKSIQITSPAPGPWEMRASGDGAYRASASGNGDVQFISASIFTEMLVGGVAMEVSVEGSLLVDESVQVRATVVGDVTNPVFTLTGYDGTTLDTLTLTEESSGMYAGGYTPAGLMGRFQFELTGTDSMGYPFQRALRRSCAVTSVGIRHTESASNPPYCTHTIEVENRGQADTFTISATTSNGFPLVVNPPSLVIGTGETATVDVSVSVPITNVDLLDGWSCLRPVRRTRPCETTRSSISWVSTAIVTQSRTIWISRSGLAWTATKMDGLTSVKSSATSMRASVARGTAYLG